MVTGWHRDTWIEVDLACIRTNIKNEQKILPKTTDIWAVVKANAYGHGMLEVAKAAKEAGAKGFCVAILDEALALRAAGFSEEPILVLGAVRAKDASLAAEKRISVTLFDPSWLEQVTETDVPLRLHLKIDTGMGRLGVRSQEEIKQAAEKIAADPRFELEGVFTHFATADQKDTAYYDTQLQRFREGVACLPKKPAYIHVANSATSLLHDQADFNVVRFGVSMYGMSPSDEIKDILPFELKPALSLKTRMVQVKELHPGDHVSYGATYEAKANEWVATLPIGYADGIIRHYSGFSFLVDGQKVPIVGRVCMDQLIVRLPREYPVGTVVTLIGQSAEQAILADEIARHLDTINYEVTCLLSDRVPRIYKENNHF
ncbi:alanine racemase [Listeria costaricensis]|uniref:alanine racemase n=1 Tax=Listeria costaricensis TaxID=2026604 RepID=UPI000C07F7A8|nr:alanine racemase [Listeria costaricensis]